MSDTVQSVGEIAHESPLSLRRLTDAFAAMLGRKPPRSEEAVDASSPPPPTISTRSITEALLFVGRPTGEPLSAAEMAATMRDIAAEEVAQAVAELNAEYAADGSPLVIVESAAGYRLTLRPEFDRVREKFYGKVRQATLSPVALEVLSVVAYRQPVTLHDIDQLRGQKSQSLASQLVRRGLIRLERPADDPKRPHYVTTERFLKVFQLASLDELPQAEEFDHP